MHTTKLIKLAVMALFALGIAFWIGNARQPEQKNADDRFLVPGLKEEINAVSSVKIVGAGGKTLVTLQKNKDGWAVQEKNDYLADIDKVRDLLIKLSDAALIEAKTSTPELYPKLGVEDVSKPDAKGAQLGIGGLKKPAEVIIGNSQDGDGTFARRAGQARSWLAKGNLAVERNPNNWLKQDLLDIPSSRVSQVDIEHEGKTLRVYKANPADANYQVADLPKGREPASEYVANGLAATLAGLRFDDVAKAEGMNADGAKVYDIKYSAFDGLVLTARAWEKDGKHYATFNAELDQAVADAYIATEQAKAKTEFDTKKNATVTTEPGQNALQPAQPPTPPLSVSDPLKDKSMKLEFAQKEVAELNRKFAGWAFVLPPYKFSNMNKTLEDMLKPLGAKTAPGAPGK